MLSERYYNAVRSAERYARLRTDPTAWDRAVAEALRALERLAAVADEYSSAEHKEAYFRALASRLARAEAPLPGPRKIEDALWAWAGSCPARLARLGRAKQGGPQGMAALYREVILGFEPEPEPEPGREGSQ